MTDLQQPQGKDSVTTAQLAYVIGVERKRIENDIQRGLLPVEPGAGTGKVRLWSIEDAVRIRFFYILRDDFGLESKVASEHASNPDIRWSVASSVSQHRSLWVIYQHGGKSRAELTDMNTLLGNEWGLSVFPKTRPNEGAIQAFVHGAILIDVAAIEKVIVSRWESWWQHANGGAPWSYFDFFKEISRLNEGFES